MVPFIKMVSPVVGWGKKIGDIHNEKTLDFP